MKRINYWAIIIVSFGVGIYLLGVAVTILSSNSTMMETGKVTDSLPSNFRDINLRSLIFSIIGGVGGIVNGIWYLMNLNNPSARDW